MAKDYARSFYNSKKWKDCRRGYIDSKNGLCERCYIRGIYSKGEIVHHKEHLTPGNIDNPKVSLNWDNLELLCQECHNKEHMSKYSATKEGLMFNDKGELIQV